MRNILTDKNQTDGNKGTPCVEGISYQLTSATIYFEILRHYLKGFQSLFVKQRNQLEGGPRNVRLCVRATAVRLIDYVTVSVVPSESYL